ncbi:oxygen-independent coproporphyrinogen III oxidase [Chryseolinea sp. T2]|uniref:oxygen-independent coproporphyrinogen III oxidase n=1 Tax=Chryseolinea sp. T2 TaxID=3129255 RepID=UPI003077F716
MIKQPSPQALLKKYDVPTPRYTSFPTVPHWNTNEFTRERWQESVKHCFEETNAANGISLYIHLPFCESLCTYCACNTRITRNHTVERPYILSLLKEWRHYCEIFGSRPVIRELHLGGGTPTFFTPANLQWLIHTLLEEADVHADRHFSFEGHPNNTTLEHLRTLNELGFDRVSFGVQDLDPRVQQAIHRIQPLGNVKQAIENARSTGYKSVGIDLIYGLPHQTPFSVSDTMDQVLALRPDRVAFYSYAHVPWLKPGQRGYENTDLPSPYLKRHFYEIGKHKLCNNGYADIGMDHFALPSDELFKAHIAGNLHRNFMGYTTTSTKLLIGLGTSAISDSGYAYAQNEKTVEHYHKAIAQHSSAVTKGHILAGNDGVIRKSILQLACRGELDLNMLRQLETPEISLALQSMEEEGLLYRHDHGITITHAGHPFIRNICSVFDPYYQAQDQTQATFSKAI